MRYPSDALLFALNRYTRVRAKELQKDFEPQRHKAHKEEQETIKRRGSASAPPPKGLHPLDSLIVN